MGRLGERYLTDPEQAIALAEQCGWLMATEVLAVGIDFSFAPVLDLNDVSDVIGDRAFAQNIQDIVPLVRAFLAGMKRAGSGKYRKTFPRSWFSQGRFSHCSTYRIRVRMTKSITKICRPLFNSCRNPDALMPAHVIYDQVDQIQRVSPPLDSKSFTSRIEL